MFYNILLYFGLLGISLMSTIIILGNKKRNITTVSSQEILPLHLTFERTQLALDLQKSSYKFHSFIDKIDFINYKTLIRY